MSSPSDFSLLPCRGINTAQVPTSTWWGREHHSLQTEPDPTVLHQRGPSLWHSTQGTLGLNQDGHTSKRQSSLLSNTG